MNTAAISFLSGVKCLTVAASLNGSLNSLAAVSLKQRLLVVKRLFELLKVECYQRLTSVKLLRVLLRVKGYQRLRGVRGLSGGVAVASASLPCARKWHLVDHCRAVKVSPLSFTCNLADTYRLVPYFAWCPSGTLSGVLSWLLLVLSAAPLLSTTPTPENFGRDLYITPHRPHAIFHNSKGVTTSVTHKKDQQ